jgi:hypothetical protein
MNFFKRKNINTYPGATEVTEIHGEEIFLELFVRLRALRDSVVKKYILFLCVMMWASSGFAAIKPHYGGNIRISEDLAPALSQTILFEEGSDELKSNYPFPFSIQKNTLTVDLSSLPADKITELEQAIDELEEESNKCHWILDYPYFHHDHANAISIEGNQLRFSVSEPEFLTQLAKSGCLIPKKISYLIPFLKTQFGYEANQNSIQGRPFLDSISPVAIDPVNPYLAFKLNEVDAFMIPEEKFREIGADEQITILHGPRFYLYLRSENLTPAQVSTITSFIHANEISAAVLNEHTELFLPVKDAPHGTVWKTPVYFKIPQETPFRYIGERLKIQLENAGFLISMKALPQNAPTLELAVEPVQENDPDLFRYRLLREKLASNGETSWFEEWDDLESAGTIVPLMLYETQIALRKNIVDVNAGSGGMPDFSNAWILPSP